MRRPKKIEDVELDKVRECSGQLAKKHLEAANLLSEKGLYNQAYVLLVYALEESAKAKICMVYDALKTKSQGIGSLGVAPKDHIPTKAVLGMFGYHDAKHLTILTQAVFELMNKPEFNKKINNALRNKDSSLDPELNDLFHLFKNLEKKRQDACFANEKGVNILDFKNEYEELLPFVVEAIDRSNSFVTKKYEYYWKTEGIIREMLNKFER